MIIVAGAIEVHPAERDAYLASRFEVMGRSRGEEGCLEYCFCADPIDKARVVLFERWASKEALDAHVAALRAGPTPPPDAVQPRASSIVVYDVTGERSLGG